MKRTEVPKWKQGLGGDSVIGGDYEIVGFPPGPSPGFLPNLKAVEPQRNPGHHRGGRCFHLPRLVVFVEETKMAVFVNMAALGNLGV